MESAFPTYALRDRSNSSPSVSLGPTQYLSVLVAGPRGRWISTGRDWLGRARTQLLGQIWDKEVSRSHLATVRIEDGTGATCSSLRHQSRHSRIFSDPLFQLAFDRRSAGFSGQKQAESETRTHLSHPFRRGHPFEQVVVWFVGRRGPAVGPLGRSPYGHCSGALVQHKGPSGPLFGTMPRLYSCDARRLQCCFEPIPLF
jgi:hypothetical protein